MIASIFFLIVHLQNFLSYYIWTKIVIFLLKYAYKDQFIPSNMLCYLYQFIYIVLLFINYYITTYTFKGENPLHFSDISSTAGRFRHRTSL